ncbi:glycosyltransferase family 4 protein [Trichocoleus desertorum AS-A10]|uniref:glycosyltransferase family 4 protein n=1 Tax=Trichocoleus desertorum TaxID=1481672 RepID=UPI003297CD21
MKLLYTLTTYPPAIGGAQLHQHLLAQRLQSHHEITVVSFWSQNRTDWLLGTTVRAHSCPYDYVIDHIPVYRMGFTWADKVQMLPWLPLYYPLMGVALPPIAQVVANQLNPFAKDADLIHNVRIGREGLTYASWKTARQRDIPFVLTPVHHPRWVGWRYRAYNKLYRQADAVITLTLSEKRTLISLGVQEDRIYVTGHAPILAPEADGHRFRQQYGIEEPIVLFLGQFYNYKGYRQVLDAAPLVWQHYPDTHFFFIGPPVKQSEQFFAEDSDPRIHRLGAVTQMEKTDALAACNLLCVPSMQESFGGVYTEAWSFSKPVVGGRIPAIADVVTEGQDGFLVNQQPEEIADRICYLLTYPDKAAAMGQAGKAKVEAQFTWPKLAEKTIKIYQAVCSR